ncbi:phage tail protein [Pantoea septica]|uniref:phage tail protein n=1 Tax=Pantoea septica TaxID=472695 RepID=UPI000AD65ECD|nr:phage tail protein [Pantoea septica]
MRKNHDLIGSGEKRRAQLNSLTVDAANSSQVIPESEGGFWIREIGLYDADGRLIAVANCPETYKPQLAEGSGRTQTVRMILIVSSTGDAALKIDPAVVLATRQYVDHIAAANPHSQYRLAADGSALPIGIPQPWPSAMPPNGWLKCNGASFSASSYPALVKVYPSLKLPDLRGEFIRGWDDGRGADSGRTLMCAQGNAIHNITGVQSLDVAYNGESEGAFYNNGKNANEGVYADGTLIQDGPPVGTASTGASTGEKIFFDASRMEPVAAESRPRNVAFNYIVRAT